MNDWTALLSYIDTYTQKTPTVLPPKTEPGFFKKMFNALTGNTRHNSRAKISEHQIIARRGLQEMKNGLTNQTDKTYWQLTRAYERLQALDRASQELFKSPCDPQFVAGVSTLLITAYQNYTKDPSVLDESLYQALKHLSIRVTYDLDLFQNHDEDSDSDANEGSTSELIKEDQQKTIANLQEASVVLGKREIHPYISIALTGKLEFQRKLKILLKEISRPMNFDILYVAPNSQETIFGWVNRANTNHLNFYLQPASPEQEHSQLSIHACEVLEITLEVLATTNTTINNLGFHGFEVSEESKSLMIMLRDELNQSHSATIELCLCDNDQHPIGKQCTDAKPVPKNTPTSRLSPS